MQTMDDGVPLAFTRYTPDGAAPAGGWPGVVTLHGLAGNRGSVDADRGGVRERRLRGARLRRPRARCLRRRGHARRPARGRRPARSEQAATQADVSDAKIGAWGISYGGGQIWNALAAGMRLAAAEVVETWTSLYDALWPQNLARPGIVAGFAATIAARSPLVAGIRDDAVQSRNLGPVRALSAERSAAARLGSIRTPVYLFQGRATSPSTSRRPPPRSRLAGPKKLYAATSVMRRRPSRAWTARTCSRRAAWFDRHLYGQRRPRDAVLVIAKRASATRPRSG